MKQFFINLREALKRFFARLSFRTGVVILILCALCYIAAFAQMLLPISATAKTVLGITFFGLAKTTQYVGLAIVGVKGWQRIKAWFKRRKTHTK